jgi:hypothetical protein
MVWTVAKVVESPTKSCNKKSIAFTGLRTAGCEKCLKLYTTTFRSERWRPLEEVDIASCEMRVWMMVGERNGSNGELLTPLRLSGAPY